MNTHSNIHQSQKGQILLIVILLSTVLLTVGLSLIDITNKDTRATKLQEDAAKARASAEAGIEAALNDPRADSINISDVVHDTNVVGTVTSTYETAQTFTTPLITKDGAYTFYITGYDPITKTVNSGTVNDELIIQRVTPTDSGYCTSDQAFSVELTFLNTHSSAGESGVVKKYLIDECNLIDGTTDEYTFGNTIPISSISPQPEVMIARVIAPSNNFDGAKLRFDKKESADWPTQGRTITATAQAGASKVTKKVSLFQSFPQIPTEFFVTQM